MTALSILTCPHGIEGCLTASRHVDGAAERLTGDAEARGQHMIAVQLAATDKIGYRRQRHRLPPSDGRRASFPVPEQAEPQSLTGTHGHSTHPDLHPCFPSSGQQGQQMIPKLTARVRFPSPALIAKAQVTDGFETRALIFLWSVF
ncbi:hypothetical protein Aple_009060 [Acrocarpospora pleiomorpha]|uniref:Uncharacterized protein n=1 Tax=Acrocarpospora pleiomorpha TaxID=90975 RepID=A0A5M3XEL3_9ACTN|nr:hypothetical protein [Acrocarpospora pleiomorpha]GES18011.1 hypothetical protein Aple_009060 [Acrocarpospora pleiomorpha]